MKRTQDILIKSFNAMWPVFYVSQLVLNLSCLANSFLVGHFLNPTAIAALGLFSPLTEIFLAVSAMVSGGYRVICGHCMGRGETDKIFPCFLSALALLGGIGVILSVCFLCFPAPIATLLGANAETMEYTISYIRGMGIAALPTILAPFFMMVVQMDNRTNALGIGAAIQAGGTLLIGYIAVKFLNGGMFGIALAIGFAQLCSIVYLCLGLRFPEHDTKTVSVSYMAEMAKIGASDATLELAAGFANYVFNFCALKYGGTVALSAISLQYIFTPFDVLCPSLSNVVGSLTSVAFGEGNVNDRKKIIRHAFVMGTPIIFAFNVISVLTIHPYARFFGATEEIIHYVRLYALNTIVARCGYMFCRICIDVFQATEHTRYSVAVSLIDQGGIVLATFLLTAIFGLTGLWFADAVAKTVTFCVILCISWGKLKHFPRSVPEMFDWVDKPDSDRSAYFEATSLQEAIGISEKIEKFLRESPAVRKNAMKSALCTEETAVNIFETAEGKKLKNPLKITMFVAVNGDEIFMKIKDNAPAFDPTQVLKIHSKDESDPAKNCGIRLVSKIAREMTYQNIFGLNALSIRI